MQIFQLLQFVPLLSALVTFIRQAQAKFDEPGSGLLKLQWVSEQIRPFLDALAASGLVKSGLMQAIREGIPTIVSLIVQIWKLFGGVKPAPVPTPVPEPTPNPEPVHPPIEYGVILNEAPDPTKLVTGRDIVYKSGDKFIVWGGAGPKPNAVFPEPGGWVRV